MHRLGSVVVPKKFLQRIPAEGPVRWVVPTGSHSRQAPMSSLGEWNEPARGEFSVKSHFLHLLGVSEALGAD